VRARHRGEAERPGLGQAALVTFKILLLLIAGLVLASTALAVGELWLGQGSLALAKLAKIAVLKSTAGALFLGGAMAVEVGSGTADADGLGCLALMTLEETMELLGIALFILALLRLLALRRGALRLAVRR